MSLMTEHEVKCMIDDALKAHMDKYVTSVRPYNGDTQSISIVMSDGNVITMDVSGLIADVLSKTKDVHVVAWTEYNPADNTGQLLMTNGTKVPVDLSAVIADAITDLAQELLTKQNALKDCSGNPLAGNVPTCTQMTTAIQNAIDALPADKFLKGLKSYNPATNTMTLLMSDGSTVDIDMTDLLADAVSGGAGIAVQDEGSVLTTAATSLNFIGTAITATSTGGAVSVNVDAVTPEQMATTLVNYADTNTATGNVLVPTGTPTGNGTNYATNSNGELFVYNKVTGQWQLISMGYRMTSVASNSVPLYNRIPYVVASFIMPRDGGIQLSASTFCGAAAQNLELYSRIDITLAVSLNDIPLYGSDNNASNYLGGSGFTNSLAGYFDVNAGDVVEVTLVMQNSFGHDASLQGHNVQLYYVS